MMTKRFFWVALGGTVALLASVAQAGYLDYQLVAVGGEGAVISNNATGPGKTVQIPPGSGTITLIMYAAVQSTNGVATDDGYNGGAMCFLSSSSTGIPKIHGSLTGTLVATGAAGVGFTAYPSYSGGASDINHDGDMDWGDTSSGSTNIMAANAGGQPTVGDLQLGTTLTPVNGVNRAMIPVATITYSYNGAADGQVAILHGYGYSNTSPQTFVRTDGVNKNPKNNATDINPRGTVLNPTFDVTVTVVPEPATLALLGAGGLVLLPLLWRRRRA
jgi:hypothetical protein